MLKYEFMKNEIERSFEDDKKFQDTIVPMETFVSKFTETDSIETMLKNEKFEFPDNNSHLVFPQRSNTTGQTPLYPRNRLARSEKLKQR